MSYDAGYIAVNQNPTKAPTKIQNKIIRQELLLTNLRQCLILF